MTLAFLMLTAFAARDEIAKFFVWVFEDRSYLESNTTGPDNIDVKYVPLYFSEGYTLTFEDTGNNIK